MKKTLWILILIIVIAIIVLLVTNKQDTSLDTTAIPQEEMFGNEEVATQGINPSNQQPNTNNTPAEEMPPIGPTQEVDPAYINNMGSYEPYAPEKLAKAENGDVILFFRADWCPTCRALDNNIRANLSSIPVGVTILDVNYDNETSLRQKYGVTYQHTLVQVDANGNMIAKWTGSMTLADLLQSIK